MLEIVGTNQFVDTYCTGTLVDSMPKEPVIPEEIRRLVISQAASAARKKGWDNMTKKQRAAALKQLSEASKLPRPARKSDQPHCVCGRWTEHSANIRWPAYEGKHCLVGPKDARRPCTAKDRKITPGS
jgi:hypothetical protein